jgi:outer membrane biogenesis lipoprotein LolB
MTPAPASFASRRRFNLHAIGLSALALMGITGCATPGGAPASGTDSTSNPPRQWRGRFQLLTPQRQSGRFILSHHPAGPGGPAGGLSGGWARGRTAERFELELLTPLGSTAALLVASQGMASLDLSDGRRFEATSLEQLTNDTLGWTVPLQQLPGWLGQLERGETIEHPAWRVGVEQTEPLRLFLAGPGQVQLRLLLDAREG